jgi:hypothetical protein
MDKSKITCKQCVEDLIINKHSACNKILSNAGTEFKNNMIQEIAHKDNISWVYCCPRHHKTIGNIERTNRTLWMKLVNCALLENLNGKNMWKKLYMLLIFRYIGV